MTKRRRYKDSCNNLTEYILLTSLKINKIERNKGSRIPQN